VAGGADTIPIQYTLRAFQFRGLNPQDDSLAKLGCQTHQGGAPQTLQYALAEQSYSRCASQGIGPTPNPSQDITSSTGHQDTQVAQSSPLLLQHQGVQDHDLLYTLTPCGGHPYLRRRVGSSRNSRGRHALMEGCRQHRLHVLGCMPWQELHGICGQAVFSTCLGLIEGGPVALGLCMNAFILQVMLEAASTLPSYHLAYNHIYPCAVTPQ